MSDYGIFISFDQITLSILSTGKGNKFLFCALSINKFIPIFKVSVPIDFLSLIILLEDKKLKFYVVKEFQYMGNCSHKALLEF